MGNMTFIKRLVCSCSKDGRFARQAHRHDCERNRTHWMISAVFIVQVGDARCFFRLMYSTGRVGGSVNISVVQNQKAQGVASQHLFHACHKWWLSCLMTLYSLQK